MTANVTTVPADILNGVASILKPYGVDIVAILAQQENNPPPPIVETLRKNTLPAMKPPAIAGYGAGRCGKRNAREK